METAGRGVRFSRTVDVLAVGAGRRPRRRDGARYEEAGRGDGGAEDAKAARGRESVAAAGDAGSEERRDGEPEGIG